MSTTYKKLNNGVRVKIEMREPITGRVFSNFKRGKDLYYVVELDKPFYSSSYHTYVTLLAAHSSNVLID